MNSPGRAVIWSMALVALCGLVLWTTQGALGEGTGDRLQLDVDAAGKVLEIIHGVRKQSVLPTLKANSQLQETADSAVFALAEAFRRNPAKPESPKELSEPGLREKLPMAAQIIFQASTTESVQSLATRLSSALTGRTKVLTHAAAAVCWLELPGQRVCVGVVLGARLVPDLNEVALNAGVQQFHLRCPFYHHSSLVGLTRPVRQNGGSFAPTCPGCGRCVAIFGADTKGKYRPAPWFLRGYVPQKITDPVQIWLFVLNHCRYVEDMKQYGQPEVWQLAEETYRLRQGDCEDTAILLADWLAGSGQEARVVVGEVRDGRDAPGHAWTVWRAEGRTYILESTGGPRTYRRVPPRAEVMADYYPRAQFDRGGLRVRSADKWTAAYYDEKEWLKAP